jgi:copper chaperone
MHPDTTVSDLSYSVPGVSCAHCEAAIVEEVGRVAGVSAVEVDLASKRVTVSGTGLDESAVRAAIEAAGYDVER